MNMLRLSRQKRASRMAGEGADHTPPPEGAFFNGIG